MILCHVVALLLFAFLLCFDSDSQTVDTKFCPEAFFSNRLLQLNDFGADLNQTYDFIYDILTTLNFSASAVIHTAVTFTFKKLIQL